MRTPTMLPLLTCVAVASALSACDSAERENARVEVTRGLAEFVTVARQDLTAGMTELQKMLDEKVEKDRQARIAAGTAGDGLPAPEDPSAPAAVIGPENGPYLFDLLEKRAFRKSWTAMFAGVTGLPPWIERFNATGDGVAAPTSTVTVGNEKYILGWVCEPHNCDGSQVSVLFSADGRDAWGLVINDESRTWLNDPAPWMLKVLDRD